MKHSCKCHVVENFWLKKGGFLLVNHLLLKHSKRIISHGCFMLHLAMIFISILKLWSFHGIDLNVLCKRNRTIQNSLANLQGQRSTSFAIPQTYWHTQKPTLHHLFLGKETKSKTFDLWCNLCFSFLFWLKFLMWCVLVLQLWHC